MVKDMEAWCAAVHGFTKGQILLSDWTTTTKVCHSFPSKEQASLSQLFIDKYSPTRRVLNGLWMFWTYLSSPQKGFVFVLCYLALFTELYCSTPGFPVLHYLLQFAQIMSIESMMPSSHLNPLSPPSPPALNLSQHQGLSNETALHIRWPNYWNFSTRPYKEYFRVDFL